MSPSALTGLVGVLLLLAIAGIIFLLFFRVVIPTMASLRRQGHRWTAVAVLVIAALVVVLSWYYGWQIGRAAS